MSFNQVQVSKNQNDVRLSDARKRLASLLRRSGVLLATSLISVAAFAQAQPAPAVPGGAPGAPGAPGQPGFLGMVMPFALMFGVFYFLMIRPQQKKMKEQKEMMSALKTGDEILTASGFLGKIVSVADQVATVDLGDNVRVRVLKTQISQVLKGGVESLKPMNG